MKKLCFGIPTWNRAEKLERCVRNIAQQIIEARVDACVFISDNCSTDATQEKCRLLAREYDFVSYRRREVHGDALDNIETVYRYAQGQYIWTVGDDDVLLPGGLNAIFNIINHNQVALIHGGHGWFKPHTQGIYRGTVLAFVNAMGFNQFIGWISANILHQQIARQIVTLSEWPTYKKNAFAHVCGILHVAADMPAIVVDYPIIEPMGHQDQEDMARWAQENVGWRYFLLIDGLKVLFDTGKLHSKLKPGFFKYLNFYLWDRFIGNMVASKLSASPWPDKGWDNILLIAEMIDDPDTVKNIRTRVRSARQLCQIHGDLKNQCSGIEQVLAEIVNETNKPVLPLTAFHAKGSTN